MNQHPQEFNWLLTKIAGVESILEIGSFYGESIRAMAMVAKPGAKIRMIDHGEPFGECPNGCKKELQATVKELRERGFDAEVLIADSHDPDSIKWAKDQGPFDFCFIDADPAYEAVKQDFDNYAPLAKRVGLHDIGFVGVNYGVNKLWAEISRTHSTQECIMSGMGVGIVLLNGAVPVQQPARSLPEPPVVSSAPMQQPVEEPRPPEAPAAVGGASGADNRSIQDVLNQLRAQGYQIMDPNAMGSPQR